MYECYKEYGHVMAPNSQLGSMCFVVPLLLLLKLQLDILLFPWMRIELTQHIIIDMMSNLVAILYATISQLDIMWFGGIK